MNQIGGILNFDDAPVAAEQLVRMARELALAYAPQQETHISANMGLVGVSSGRTSWTVEPPRPLVRSPRGSVLALDGRIDNRDDLLAALGQSPAPNGGPTSPEAVVLAAYEKWGDHVAEHLLGDFALVIWDPEARTILCARDHFGARPLYYHASSESFVFASTPRAVLASGRLPTKINEVRIADFLIEPWPSLDCIDTTSSFYEGVARLEPAHTLVASDSRLAKRRYWQPSPAPRPAAMTDAECIGSFREMLTEAVRCRLPVTSPPASMLSGGIDSAAVVAMARQILSEQGRGPLHTFSAVSDKSRVGGDPEHIAAVLGQGGLLPHVLSEADVVPQIEALMTALATEPAPFDWLMNMVRALFATAQAGGVDTLLDGIDGDTLILKPYPVRAWLWRQGALRSAVEETLAANGVEAWAASRWVLFFESLRSAATPDSLRRLQRNGRYRSLPTWAVQNTIINPDFALRSSLGDRWATLDANMSPLGRRDPVGAHMVELNHPGVPARLEREQRAAGAFGIELVHPLLDVRLAEFCLGLPWQLQTRRGWTKLILRRAVEPMLPATVVWRKTRDALGRWFNILVLKERESQLREIVMDERHTIRAYVDVPKLLRLWTEYTVDGDERHEIQIWHAIALAMWLRRQREFSSSVS